MTTPEEIAARREAFEDDDDNRRPDYPAAVKTIVTAVRDLAAVERERDELRRWKAEALEVIAGLQELGKALGLRLGERITGEAAAEAAKRLTERAEEAEATVARVAALCESLRNEGIACECGHTLDEHNGLGCYARLSYTPLVACECKLTDDRTHEDLLEPLLRAALEGGDDE